MLPKFASLLEQPLYASITGFTGVNGIADEPVNPCDDALSGFMKGCNLTAQFGRVARATNTIEWDKVMTKLNAGVTTDLMLRGRLLGMDDFNPTGLSEDEVLYITVKRFAGHAGVGVNLACCNLIVQAWELFVATASRVIGWGSLPNVT